MENSPSRSYVLEISGIQVVAVVFFALISLAAALTLGRTQLAKRLLALQKSTLPVDAQRPAVSDRPSETSSPSALPAANAFPVPEANPPALPPAGSLSESSSVRPLDTRPEAPPIGARPVAASPQRDTSNGLVARNAPPPVKSQASHLSKTADPMSAGPANPIPRRVPPAMRAARHLLSPSTILVSGPGDGSKPFRLTLPEKPIAASSSFAMTSQLSVLVPPEPGSAPNHKSARLQAGELVSFVWPRYPRPGDRHGSAETVKVRTTIGELGQVLEVKHVSGSLSLFPAANSAIRQWRYKPTLLNSRPVQAQQEVTIEFRPPQHLPRLSTEGPSYGGK
ncbi:MAG TPA: energy transducer TonB [Candidatus Acidoferrum sp.]|nr:energy transducer TonB [Candidatus Acidoferrum sp.]